MLLQAASSGGKPVASIPGYLKQQHAMRAVGSSGSLAGSVWNGGVAGGDVGAPTGPAQQAQPPGRPASFSQAAPVGDTLPGWQTIHFSADGIILDDPAVPVCRGAGCAPQQAEQQAEEQQEQQQEQQAEQQAEQQEQQAERGRPAQGIRRSSSISLEPQPGWTNSAGSGEAWQERAELGTGEGSQHGSLASIRSRASSAGSFASLLGATAGAAGAAGADHPPHLSGGASLLGGSGGRQPSILHAPDAREEGLCLRRTSSSSLHSLSGGTSGPQPQPPPGSVSAAAGSPQVHRREKIRVRLKLRTDGPKPLR
jgi:hypothetical protein